MATARSSTRGNARNEVIEMLKEDHKRARKAFRDFEKLDPETDAEQCDAIVRQACAELTLHATLEEECFYPAARGGLDEPDLIDEAEVEHMTAKRLIEQLRSMSPGDDKYGATFTVLGEYIKHHAKEEEEEMFPKLGRTNKIDWDALCDEMNSRRAELVDELLPAAAADTEAQPASSRPAPARSRAGQAARPAAKTTRGARPQAARKATDAEE